MFLIFFSNKSALLLGNVLLDLYIYKRKPEGDSIFHLIYLKPKVTLNVVPDARVRNIISKGPKYRFPTNIDFPLILISLIVVERSLLY